MLVSFSGQQFNDGSNNVEITLIRRWKRNKIWRFQFWYNVSDRRWSNVETTLHNVRTTLYNVGTTLLQYAELSLQSAFPIKLYMPGKDSTVGQISYKNVQCFLCLVVTILSSDK